MSFLHRIILCLAPFHFSWKLSPPPKDGCSPCGVGSFALFGTTKCQACAPGSFSAVTGASACTSCLPGTFALLERSSSCLECSQGGEGFKNTRNSPERLMWTYFVNNLFAHVEFNWAFFCLSLSLSFRTLFVLHCLVVFQALETGSYAEQPQATECFKCPLGTYGPTSLGSSRRRMNSAHVSESAQVIWEKVGCK